MINSFQELIVWQKASKLFLQIYQIFSEIKLYHLKEQILAATLSISNNIAEGFERKNQKDFRRFIIYANASLHEVKSMLLISTQLSEFDQNQVQLSLVSIDEFQKLIGGLLKFQSI